MRRAFALTAVAAFLATAVAPGAANAAVWNSNLDVSTQVTSSAQVSATPLAFGTYVPASTNPTDRESTITVTASVGTNYIVAIDAGQGSGATAEARTMETPGDDLTYSIYRNSARTDVWGSTYGNNTSAGVGNGSAQTLTAYGRIPAQQTARPGSYQDTLIVTVIY